MFVDKVTIYIAGGDGGDGAVSFRREKFIDRGGPDGGDGGDGGSVIAVASTNEDSLAAFRHTRGLSAEKGHTGQKRNKHGKRGANLTVHLPVGSVVLRDGEVIADLTEAGVEHVLAAGGKGGFGNAHFVSSVRQAPRVAEKGEPGDSFDAVIELKSIADVGIIGLPNAGKSTFLSVVSNARPEIADYPFTTLVPNLGVVDIDKTSSLLFADIPGLIEGASQGKGLGGEFLRHVERTKVLLHLIDAYDDDVATSFKVVDSELSAYSKNLAKRDRLVVMTKIEGLDTQLVAEKLQALVKAVPKKTKVMAVSAVSKEGLKEVLFELQKLTTKALAKEPPKEESAVPVIKPDFQDEAWKVEKTKKGFLVTGRKIEKFAVRTRFEDDFSVRRIRDIMHKNGILRELKRQGLKAGDRIQIGEKNIGSFEF